MSLPEISSINLSLFSCISLNSPIAALAIFFSVLVGLLVTKNENGKTNIEYKIPLLFSKNFKNSYKAPTIVNIIAILINNFNK